MQDVQRIGLVNKRRLVGSCFFERQRENVDSKGSNISMHVCINTDVSGFSYWGETKPAATFQEHSSSDRSAHKFRTEDCTGMLALPHTGIHICKVSWPPIHQGTIAELLKNRQQSPSERMKNSRVYKQRGTIGIRKYHSYTVYNCWLGSQN